MMFPSRTLHRHTGLALLAAAALSGCVAAPRPYPTRESRVDYPPAPTEVVVYPLRGQGSQRLDRDRYECHLWAVRESGFDPSRMSLRSSAPPPRVEPDPPSGYSTTMGAVSGAVIGAAVANPHRTAEGAAIGAVTLTPGSHIVQWSCQKEDCVALTVQCHRFQVVATGPYGPL